MKNIQESTADNLSRGTLPEVRYDVIKVNDNYIYQKSEGGNIPAGYITEIQELSIKTADGTQTDLTTNVKEIRVNYGN